MTLPKAFLIHLLIILVVGIRGVVLAQSLDENGNYRVSGLQSLAPLPLSHQYIGDVLNSFPNPSALRGLTFREGKLWGVTEIGSVGTGSGVLFEMDADSGAVISTITISSLPPSTFGLGFDTKRNVFVVTDTKDDLILKVDPTSGNVIDSFPSPGSGPSGAAYDSTRDGYWIPDFFTNTVDLVNPDTGVKIISLSVPSGASRIAGTGYDSVNDVIMFNSRNSAETYLMRARDGVQVGVFPTPPSPGLNNGQGAAIRPTNLTGYLTNFEVATIFVVDLELSIPQPVAVDINPDTFKVRVEPDLQPKEPKGAFLTAFIKSPEGSSAADIDASTVTLSVNGTTLATAENPVLVDNILQVLFRLDLMNVGTLLGVDVIRVAVKKKNLIKVKVATAPAQPIDLIEMTISADLIGGGSFSDTDAVLITPVE